MSVPRRLAVSALFVVTAALIAVCIPLGTFGVEIPTAFLVPYMPFEFLTGIFIVIKSRSKKLAIA